MTKKLIFTYCFILMALIAGCNESTPLEVSTEMNAEMNLEQNTAYLLTKNEARLALLNMMDKYDKELEVFFKIGAEIEEKISQATIKVKEEAAAKEKELIEMIEDKEELQQALQKNREETEENILDVLDRYYIIRCAELRNIQHEEDEEEESPFIDPDEKVSFDKLFEEYVVIEIDNRKNPEHNGDWVCDLKAGWFEKSTATQYFANTVRGHFRKNKNNEWVATIVSFTGGDILP
jgi:hypothetical protein